MPLKLVNDLPMKHYKFPKTYADLDAAPWCWDYERADLPLGSGDPIFIHVYSNWFPEDYGERTSACGFTLKDALADLRDLWNNYMRPPQVEIP